jgi:hypothetical protein
VSDSLFITEIAQRCSLLNSNSNKPLYFKNPQILEPWKEQFAAKRDFFISSYNEMKVNHNLYPQPVLKCVVDTLKISLNASDLFEQANSCNDEDLSGIQGSFRKLEID